MTECAVSHLAMSRAFVTISRLLVSLQREHIVENNIHHLVAVLEDVITKMPPGVEK